jgi:hypothetical protein
LGCCTTVKERVLYLVSSADHAAVRCTSLQSAVPSTRSHTNLPRHLSSITLRHCSPKTYRPRSTPIQYSQQPVAVCGMFVDGQRQDKIPEPTVPDIPAVSSVASCVVVAFRIDGVVPKCLNWHLVVLHCVRKTREFSSAWVARYPDCICLSVCVCSCCVAVRLAGIPQGASARPSGATGSIAGWLAD